MAFLWFKKNKEQLDRSVEDDRSMEDDGNGLCRIHQVPLSLMRVRILYGYPTPIVGQIDRKFPNHGLWSSLGGCVISESSPVTEDTAVCWKCREMAQSLQRP